MSRTLVLIILISLFSSGLFAQSGSGAGSVTPKEWPGDFFDRLRNDIENEWDSQGQSISASIFESITDLSLFSQELGPVTLGAQIKREVYNNHDILDSWTVVDFFKIPLTLPIYVSGDVPVGPLTVGAKLSANLSLSTINIRQVLPKEYGNLPKIEDIKSNMNTVFTKDDEDDDYQVVYSELPDDEKSWWEKFKQYMPWNSQNPQTRARYSKILNLLIGPFKLPLTSKSVLKMPEGEIRSYSLDGGVQLSGNVGWSMVAIPGFDTLSVGIGVTTYLTGKFRISILKESDHVAHVKMTRLHKEGITGYMGSTHEVVPFDGFVILGQEGIGRIKESLIPFNLSVDLNTSRSFDVGYTYDLRNPRALNAYLHAVWGRFKRSEELHSAGDGVERKYTRKQKEIKRSKAYRLKLSFIYERASSRTTKNTSAVISTPEGVRHIFKGSAENNRSFDTLWGNYERKSYSFQTLVDRDRYYTSNGGILFRMAGKIEDSRTTGKEMRKYIHEVEKMTGQRGLFPYVPVYKPKPECTIEVMDEIAKKGKKAKHYKKCTKRGKVARYGKSSFYYRVGLKRESIETFAQFPRDKMWEIMEKSFSIKKGRWSSKGKRFLWGLKNFWATTLNLPLALVDVNIRAGSKLYMAKRFVRRWKKVKYVRSVKELTKRMAGLFTTSYFSTNLIQAVKETIRGQQYEYYVTSNASKVFGYISKVGNALDNLDEDIDQLNRQIDFENPSNRIIVDAEAVVEQLKIQAATEDQAKITFNLKIKPEFLFFRVDRTANWSRYKRLMTAVILNQKRFKKGYNEIIVNRDDTEGLEGLLAPALFNGKFVTLKIAIGRNRGKWGAVSSYRIRLKKPRDDDDEDDDSSEKQD